MRQYESNSLDQVWGGIMNLSFLQMVLVASNLFQWWSDYLKVQFPYNIPLKARQLFHWELKALVPFLMLVEILVDLATLGYSLYMYWYLLGDLICRGFCLYAISLYVDCSSNIRCDFFKTYLMLTAILLGKVIFYTVEEMNIQLFTQRSHINN